MESRGDFWQKQDLVARVQREKKALSSLVASQENLQECLDEVELLCDCALEDDDEALAREALEKYRQTLAQFHLVRTKALLSGEHDANNALVAINAGAGGTESCDWASMLQRMIVRWAESKGFPLSLPPREGRRQCRD